MKEEIFKNIQTKLTPRSELTSEVLKKAAAGVQVSESDDHIPDIEESSGGMAHVRRHYGIAAAAAVILLGLGTAAVMMYNSNDFPVTEDSSETVPKETAQITAVEDKDNSAEQPAETTTAPEENTEPEETSAAEGQDGIPDDGDGIKAELDKATMTMKDVTPTRGTLVISKNDDSTGRVLDFGEEYRLLDDEGNELPRVIDDNVCWEMIAYETADSMEMNVYWEWLYGSLPDGRYYLEKTLNIYGEDRVSRKVTAELIIDTQNDWEPDPEPADYGSDVVDGDMTDENGYSLAIGQIVPMPVDEYPSVRWEEQSYTCINECYAPGHSYNDHSWKRGLPNESYVAEQLGTVSAVSAKGGSDTQAEVYSLQGCDSAFIIALKFPDSPRYFLYEAADKEYNSLNGMLRAINYSKMIVDETAVLRGFDYSTRNNGREIAARLMTMNGALTDTPSDSPMMSVTPGSQLYNVSFGIYSGGIITVNAGGSVRSYQVGQDAVNELLSIIG